MFVERKTHRESWKGEESVKDRITLPKGKIVEFLDGTYTLDQAMKEGKVCSLISAARHLCAGVENQFLCVLGLQWQSNKAMCAIITPF